MANFHVSNTGLRVVGVTADDVIEVLTESAQAQASDDTLALKIGGVVVNNRRKPSKNTQHDTVYLDLAMQGGSYSVARVDGDIRVTNVSTGELLAVLQNAKNLVMGKPN